MRVSLPVLQTGKDALMSPIDVLKQSTSAALSKDNIKDMIGQASGISSLKDSLQPLSQFMPSFSRGNGSLSPSERLLPLTEKQNMLIEGQATVIKEQTIADSRGRRDTNGILRDGLLSKNSFLAEITYQLNDLNQMVIRLFGLEEQAQINAERDARDRLRMEDTANLLKNTERTPTPNLDPITQSPTVKKGILSSLESLFTGLTGGLGGRLTKIFGALTPLLRFAGRLVPLMLLADNVFEVFRKGKDLAKMFGVGSNWSASLGALFGGLGQGIKNAYSNGGKWAMYGAGLGLTFGGPIGALFGGAVGGIVGFILGAIGGERIAKFLDHPLKVLKEAFVDVLSYPVMWAMDAYDWIRNKISSNLNSLQQWWSSWSWKDLLPSFIVDVIEGKPLFEDLHISGRIKTFTDSLFDVFDNLGSRLKDAIISTFESLGILGTKALHLIYGQDYKSSRPDAIAPAVSAISTGVGAALDIKNVVTATPDQRNQMLHDAVKTAMDYVQQTTQNAPVIIQSNPVTKTTNVINSAQSNGGGIALMSARPSINQETTFNKISNSWR